MMEINIPAKILRASVSSSTAIDEWPFDDGLGDTFWAGGSNPKPFQWEVILAITAQSHSSHLTREANTFNGVDVKVGDFIAGSQDGVVNKIISISSKTTTSVTCIVEDVLRYNTFRSTTGNGLFTVPGNVIIFEVNEDGEPVLDPLPAGFISTEFSTNIESRFRAFALQENFPLEQVSHGFSEGDVIAIDPSSKEFELADANSFDRVVGTVKAAGPGPNQFLVKPTTQICENFEPALPGSVGDIIHADPTSPGDLTTTETGRAVFMKLTDAIPTILNSTVSNPSTTIGNQVFINDILVTFTTGFGDIDDVIGDINSLTGSHGVIATKIFTETSVTTSIPDLIYGLVGAFTDPPGPASATINGSLVTFSTNDRGQAAFATDVAIQGDMAFDINNAGITDIVARFDSTTLTVANTAGGAITIVNVNGDENGNPWAGLSPDSTTGLALSTLANTDELIRFTRADGGEIIFENEFGDPVGDLGLVSGHNGRLPIGLIVEQGIRKGDMFVVADITARDALTPLIGDQAMVLDKDDGEWGMFLYDGTQWLVTGTEEAAEVDSASETIFIIPSSTAGLNNIAEVNDGTRVSLITVDVTTPFDGTPTLEIGDAGDTDRLMTSNQIDLNTAGTYAATPVFHYTGGIDIFIAASFSPGGSTVGSATVTITYS